MTEKKVASKTNSSTKTKLTDMEIIKLTAKEFEAKSAEELFGLVCSPDNRISRERGVTFLADAVTAGKVNAITPEVIMNWTYNSVRVTGVTAKGGFSPERAKKKLTKEEFTALKPKQVAALIAKYTHKRRAAETILPALIQKGLPLSAEDVVFLTCGRVEVEGVVIIATRQTAPALTDGVTFA